MKPEPRDFRLVDRVISALGNNPDSIILLKCYNKDEADMLKYLMPDWAKNRIQYTYNLFKRSVHDRNLPHTL